jgi:hypothetical protein
MVDPAQANDVSLHSFQVGDAMNRAFSSQKQLFKK